MEESELLVIGGRSGVGKSTAAAALHALLRADDVAHAVIEGDALDLAWPTPWEHRLSMRNLAAVWANYRELGYRRLVYTNTVAVLEVEELAAAMGDAPRTTAVLLTAGDAVADARLALRESGLELDGAPVTLRRRGPAPGRRRPRRHAPDRHRRSLAVPGGARDPLGGGLVAARRAAPSGDGRTLAGERARRRARARGLHRRTGRRADPDRRPIPADVLAGVGRGPAGAQRLGAARGAGAGDQRRTR